VFTAVSYAGGMTVGTISESVTGSGSVSGNEGDAGTSSDAASDAAVDKTATGTGVVADLTDVSAIVEETMPSIVAITNISNVTYRSFFGQSQTYESESCGSGIIIAQDADYIYIVTNNHVVSGADTLTVQFVDDTTVSCEIQGTDSSDDLAVVKAKISSIEQDTLNSIKVASVGDSDSLKVGEATIAIGNALGYGQSVTTGIVSALGRTVTVSDSTTSQTVTNTNLIQTDAAINPGNSGGALLNARGEVIGINSAKYSDTDVEGIGYAIPITDAMDIVNQLIETGTVTSTQTAYLGIKGTDVSQDMSQAYGMPVGVYVYSVISGSGAESAGLRQGDIITAMDGQTVSTMVELQSLLKSYEAGDTVTLTVERIQNSGYEAMQVSVTLSGASTVTQ
jgi:serine protease Do